MKIHKSIVSRAIVGMSKDINNVYPDLHSAISKQEKFSLGLMEEHGIAFATLVLPAAGKWLDHCLANGRIQDNRPLYHGHRPGSKIPKYLWYLWERVFDREGVLRESPDHTAVFFLRQSYYFAKKLNMQCEQERIEASVSSFLKLEHSLPPSHPDSWDSDDPIWKTREGHPIYGSWWVESRQTDLFGVSHCSSSLPWNRLRDLCRRLTASWGHLDVLSLRPKHGPGAVSDATPGIKYDFEIWPRKLESIFPADWFASHDFVARWSSDKEIGSLMHAVPKTQKGPRLIAAEPIAHQWAQGSLQRWLEEKVSSSPLALSIDFRNQSYSQELALDSSKTGEYATIDLSEASDRLTTRLVEYVFQGHHVLLDCLHACRTRYIQIPARLTGSGPRTVLLKKFSTMGSAVTFPVQTIVFTLLGHFALMVKDEDWDVTMAGMRRRAKDIRVFGDDIIIRADAYGTLVDILQECLLKVNKDKSFHQGLFREACGMDAFDGVDVTPAYIRTPYSQSKPESLGSIVECSNNFHKKGMWNTADAVLKTVPAGELALLLRTDQDIGTIPIFTYCKGVFLEGIKTRWNASLHKREALALQLLSRGAKVRGSGEASLMQFFIEEPGKSPLSKWEAGQPRRPRIKKQPRWVGLNE